MEAKQPPKMTARPNPLFEKETDPTADLTELNAPNIHRPKRNTHKRELRDARRITSAAEAIAGFGKDLEIYGFTKGQFSIIDLLRAVLEYTGPAEVVISTWTAANTDISTVLDFCETEKITRCRWLVDDSLQRRYPELAHRIRETFGADSIRVAKTHAKFYLVSNADWKIVIHTSMNINFNARFENFSLANDPDLYDFHADIIAEIWDRQPRNLAAETNCYEVHRFWHANH